MLYHLSLWLKSYSSFFNLFHYISFRAMCAFMTTLSLSFIFGERFIATAGQRFASKPREFTPESHQQKDNMPTLGGLFILVNVFVAMMLWGNLLSPKVWICLLCFGGFGAIGLFDDLRKLFHGTGISAIIKSGLQIAVSLIVVLCWLYFVAPSTDIVFPFFKNLHPNIGMFFIAWAMFVLIACSNAVNLTDGLDGLAVSSLISNFGVFTLIAYIAGHAKIAAYLQIPFAGTAELAILGASLLGASLGFLWYNTYPAQIFMGDVGSISLGAVLGLMALMAKQELLFVISGGLFVIETLSVIVQVFSFKYLGRRIFRMAPIHHHFELKGWSEPKITVRFAIISFVLGMIALMTLKMR